jgi:hypothetical protein
MGRNGGRGDVWATLGALLVAHAIGGVVVGVVAVAFGVGGAAGGLGLSIHGSAEAAAVAFLVLSSLVTSLALRPLLAAIAGLEISQASAFTAILVGGAVELMFQLILASQPSAGPSLMPLAPVLLVAPFAVQLSLIRSFAVSRSRSPWLDDRGDVSLGDGLD